jgi:hypothetical protein
MNHRIIGAVVCLYLVGASAGIVQAQQRRAPARTDRPNASARISGRVFDANTNTPIRRAQIQGSNDELFVDALSDDEGRFQLANLPPASGV